MITTNSFEAEGRSFIRTAGDSRQIRKLGTNEIYSEAIDLADSGFNYEETDLPLDDDIATYEELEAALTELGGIGMTKGELKTVKQKVAGRVSQLSDLAQTRGQRLAAAANMFSDTAWSLLPSAVKEILKEFRN